MKLFQYIISPTFRNSVCFSLKILAKDSPYKISHSGKRYLNTSFLCTPTASAHISISKFHTSSYTRRDIKGLDNSQPKKRFQRKKTQKWKDNLDGQVWSAIAYSSAEGYKMQSLLKELQNQGIYECLPLPEDAQDDLHLCSKEESSGPPSHIYIFGEGSVVFWNVSDQKQKEMLSFLKPYEIKSYDSDVVEAEKEDLDYTFSEDETSFNDGYVVLNSKNSTDLFTYTFSNSLAQSVKLGILEAALEEYSNSIEWVPDGMKNGKKIKMSRKEIFAKRGELFSLRHVINLSSDLLDTPDFYWDRKDLEVLYQQTCNYLDIPKRIRTMNVRLSYCSELVDLLVNHMNDEHHVRLEWMIIILIMVEVVFECMHFLERFTH